MRVYEVVTDQVTSQQVIKATEGEKTLWIPLDPTNSDYAEYLRYTEWVEAGNNPEDFWTSEEGIDVSS